MILSGKQIADEIQESLKTSLASFPSRPGLAVIILGNNPSSHAYVTMKKKVSESLGMHSLLYHLPETASESELLNLIHKLNTDPSVDGILTQLPLPKHINPFRITEAIDPQKDIDGFHPENLGKLLSGKNDGFIPCTPLGIKVLLEKYQIDCTGKDVVILGRSAIVGKPLAALLMQNAPGSNATVTVLHSKSQNIKAHCLQADILIAALGSPRFITADMVKEGAVVIDVGINRVADQDSPRGYRLVGDVDFEEVQKLASAITPVPKGVGPMTVAMLMQNTVLSYQRRRT